MLSGSTSKKLVSYIREHLREINENKLETLLALRADVLARAGERLTDEDTSQVSAQAIHSPIRAKMETNAVARTIMQRQHYLTAAERDEVARLYQDGLPVRTICERFDISKGGVYRIRRWHRPPGQLSAGYSVLLVGPGMLPNFAIRDHVIDRQSWRQVPSSASFPLF